MWALCVWCCQGFGHLLAHGWWAGCTASRYGCMGVSGVYWLTGCICLPGSRPWGLCCWLQAACWLFQWRYKQHVIIINIMLTKVEAVLKYLLIIIHIMLVHVKLSHSQTSHLFLCRSGVYGHTLNTSPMMRSRKRKRTESHSAESVYTVLSTFIRTVASGRIWFSPKMKQFSRMCQHELQFDFLFYFYNECVFIPDISSHVGWKGTFTLNYVAALEIQDGREVAFSKSSILTSRLLEIWSFLFTTVNMVDFVYGCWDTACASCPCWLLRLSCCSRQ